MKVVLPALVFLALCSCGVPPNVAQPDSTPFAPSYKKTASPSYSQSPPSNAFLSGMSEVSKHHQQMRSLNARSQSMTLQEKAIKLLGKKGEMRMSYMKANKHKFGYSDPNPVRVVASITNLAYSKTYTLEGYVTSGASLKRAGYHSVIGCFPYMVVSFDNGGYLVFDMEMIPLSNREACERMRTATLAQCVNSQTDRDLLWLVKVDSYLEE